MEYRKLGRTGFEVSEVSLGTEYLIRKSGKHVASVIGTAIERGVNYFDVFWAQPRFRDNMGAAFAGHRDQVFLAAHLGSAHIDGQYQTNRDPETCRLFLEDFLRRYRTDYVDVLFLHNSDGQPDFEEIMKPGGLKDLALEYRDRGVARSIGFSGHTMETALQAVESGIVDVLMFPVSIAGNAVPGKKELLSACARRDVGVVAMKIFGGGKLLSEWGSAKLNQWQLGGGVKTLERSIPLTPVRGIHYALSQRGVSTVVPGCSTVGELEADLAYFDAPQEERDYAGVLADIRQFENGECVFCNHCLPCPSGIDIGMTIRLLENGRPDLSETIEAAYGAMGASASDCVECGACEERCPFEVKVIPKMREATSLFGK